MGDAVLTKDDIEKIGELKKKGYSQSKTAQALKVSRSTVLKYWGGYKLRFDDVFSVGSCPACGTVYPRPKFQYKFTCPYCRKEFLWKDPCFKPEARD